MAQFKKISIIGLGLIASSICLTLRQKDPTIQIVGYDKDKLVRDRANDIGLCKIESNIDKLCSTQSFATTEIHVCSVLNIYNMLNLRNLVDWIIQHNWYSDHKIKWKCILTFKETILMVVNWYKKNKINSKSIYKTTINQISTLSLNIIIRYLIH